MNENYLNAARLLLSVAPVVFRQPLFALEGGTAIDQPHSSSEPVWDLATAIDGAKQHS